MIFIILKSYKCSVVPKHIHKEQLPPICHVKPVYASGSMDIFSTVYPAIFLFSHQGQNIWSVAVNESKQLIVSICSHLLAQFSLKLDCFYG